MHLVSVLGSNCGKLLQVFTREKQKEGLIFRENDHHVVYEVSRRRLRQACERV
jgi:hypothetical protein